MYDKSKLKEYHINVYSYDDIKLNKIRNYYYPYIDENDMPMRRFGMLYRNSKPVIGIFGTSSKPDIVLLCINPFDDINYIMRTINFIESSIDCKVQSLIVFPMNRKKDWLGNFGRLEQINGKDFSIECKKLEKITKRKVYLLNEEKDIEQAVEQLIDTLSEV